MNSITSSFSFPTSHMGVSSLVRAVKVLYGDHPTLPSVSVYFQGCDAFPKCHGCHNPETWDFDENFVVGFEHLETLTTQKISFLLSRFEKVGLALLGGEPLSERNRYAAYLLAKRIKERVNKQVTVIVYTWRLPEDLEKIDIPLVYFDEFVMGRYIKEYHQDGFPASRNQLYITYDELCSRFNVCSMSERVSE
ncbi:MAG: 4Fe-4S cluster-binding domain-containing protein [Fervidobacterium sp.]